MKSNSPMLGLKIRKYRELRGLSQAELADRLHMDQSAYSRLERGETMPTAERLRQLGEALNVSAEELVSPDPIVLTIHHANGTQVGNGYHVQFEQHVVDKGFVREVLDRLDKHVSELHGLIKSMADNLTEMVKSKEDRR